MSRKVLMVLFVVGALMLISSMSYARNCRTLKCGPNAHKVHSRPGPNGCECRANNPLPPHPPVPGPGPSHPRDGRLVWLDSEIVSYQGDWDSFMEGFKRGYFEQIQVSVSRYPVDIDIIEIYFCADPRPQLIYPNGIFRAGDDRRYDLEGRGLNERCIEKVDMKYRNVSARKGEVTLWGVEFNDRW
ncbi:MAG: hypothetical protein ABIA04_07640 [Pseudomonadota bacterium]